MASEAPLCNQTIATHHRMWKLALALQLGKEDLRRSSPRFWLADSGGKQNQKFSSLDLTARAGETEVRTFHVLLILDVSQSRAKIYERQLLNKFTPMKKIRLSNANGMPGDVVFASGEDIPSFLPSRFAVVIRPDGQVAWLENG